MTERHAEIQRSREAPWTINTIAGRFGPDRTGKTVRRYPTTDLDVLIASARELAPYRPCLQRRFADGCANAAQGSPPPTVPVSASPEECFAIA
ncbi:hypothetical protein AB0D57_05410 [Streptomyces sp. NPDC048275]|uniref:hypothetical protein n=1 Tax=Streptomyces sp. NPDC048275 TaxID=3155629 RepID=UPI0033F06328